MKKTLKEVEKSKKDMKDDKKQMMPAKGKMPFKLPMKKKK